MVTSGHGRWVYDQPLSPRDRGVRVDRRLRPRLGIGRRATELREGLFQPLAARMFRRRLLAREPEQRQGREPQDAELGREGGRSVHHPVSMTGLSLRYKAPSIGDWTL